jgi:uncharacterized surface protein with fasciclin (FAS1) repeats
LSVARRALLSPGLLVESPAWRFAVALIRDREQNLLRRDAADSVETLLKPQKVLGDALVKMNNDDGHKLKASIAGSDVILTHQNAGTAKVAIADVQQSNGVIHVIDSVLLSK